MGAPSPTVLLSSCSPTELLTALHSSLLDIPASNCSTKRVCLELHSMENSFYTTTILFFPNFNDLFWQWVGTALGWDGLKSEALCRHITVCSCRGRLPFRPISQPQRMIALRLQRPMLHSTILFHRQIQLLLAACLVRVWSVLSSLGESFS